MAQIYDCFIFFNELDLLELRLRSMDKLVDRFVLVEARETFQGQPKPCHFADNAHLFEPYLDRIEHIVIDAFRPATSSWQREIEQRNRLNAYVDGLALDDIVLLSDVDEILRPDMLRDLRDAPPQPNEVVCFELTTYLYYLNYQHPEPWLRQSPRAVLQRSFTGMQNLRDVRGPVGGMLKNAIRGAKAAIAMKRLVHRRHVRDAGWHFSWLGGDEAVLTKAQSISTHRGMSASTDQLKKDTLEKMAARMAGGEGCTRVEIDTSFPELVQRDPDRWARFII